MVDEADARASGAITTTPQLLLLAFLGIHLQKPIAVSSASIVDIFGSLDVGQAATRSLLARMTDRGMLDRRKSGRKTYYSLSPRGAMVLEDGSRRVWRDSSEVPWDGQWTTIVMSVPEDSRHLRHRARSRLGWTGFGNTSSGLWVAPRRHDVAAILGTEFANADITVLVGQTTLPTTDQSLVASAYDLESIAQRYVEFHRRWSNIGVIDLEPKYAFALRIRLQAEWVSIGRADPLLPEKLLPAQWPANAADLLFRTLDATLDRASSAIESDLLDSILLEPAV